MPGRLRHRGVAVETANLTMITRVEDGSILDDNGKVLWFSLERFVRDICEGDCCFVCGRSPKDVIFNAEHVLPDWILTRYNLRGRTVHLPNGTEFRYDRYKVPCCADCNTAMGAQFETPISQIVDGGFDALEKHIRERGPMLFFLWMNLIFLKTHLKDRNLRFNRDLRLPPDPISGLYDWATLHHVHAVARSFYIRASFAKEIYGSSIIIPVRTDIVDGGFDFLDLYAAQVIGLRLGNIGFLTVLNDSCATTSIMSSRLTRLGPELSEIQFRELLADMAFINLHLKERPVFRTEVDAMGKCHIAAEHSATCELIDFDKTVRGKLLSHVWRPFLPVIEPLRGDREQFLRSMETGNASFLFDDNGQFISTPAVRLPAKDDKT